MFLWEALFKNYSQNLITSKTGCHGNEIEFFKQFFKNPLLWNRWSDFEIISQEYSLGDPFQKLFAKVWYVHKHGSCKWGLLALYGYEQILKKSSQKPLVRFWNNFKGMFLGDPLQKLFAKYLIGNGGFLHYMDMKKFLRNLQNCWSDFEIIPQKCSLSDLSKKSLAKFWSVIKHGSSEWGLLSLYGHEWILKKYSSLKALARFRDNFIELFLEWPFSKVVGEILICQQTWH